MHYKSLAINEALGYKEGIASDCGSMGRIYQSQGKPDKAKNTLLKSHKLFIEIGATHKAALVNRWLQSLK